MSTFVVYISDKHNANIAFVRLVLILSICICGNVQAQFVKDENQWVGQLNLKGGLTDKLLSTRTAVFFDHNLTAGELTEAQQQFQRTGIDAVVYFELDMIIAGKDVSKAFSNYIIKREIVNLLLMEKLPAAYRLTITAFNGKESIVDSAQHAWSITNRVLGDALKELYKIAASQQKKSNLLINDQPETGILINPIPGKRNEFFAIDTKVDPLAVVQTGDEVVDKELEEIFNSNYSLKFKMTPPGLTEKELRKQGLLYVLCVVRTRNIAAQQLLGYDVSKAGEELISVTYPATGQESKKIAANMPVYKFYFKHIDSGNVFLGTKWDADITWQQALLNQLKGMKAELRLN